MNILFNDPKIILGTVAVVMTLAAHIPYLLTTLRGSNHPHIFTWLIWTALTFIASAVQWREGAGPGAWVTLSTGIICVIITLAAFRSGRRNIRPVDIFMFIAAIGAIPIWAATDDPTWAIAIVTAIDCSAFLPTLRKSWSEPHRENSFMYGFNIPRHAISIAALTQLSFTTAVYPASLLAMNMLMYAALKLRRVRCV